jgi:hypothetical protein
VDLNIKKLNVLQVLYTDFFSELFLRGITYLHAERISE